MHILQTTPAVVFINYTVHRESGKTTRFPKPQFNILDLQQYHLL